MKIVILNYNNKNKSVIVMHVPEKIFREIRLLLRENIAYSQIVTPW